MIPSSMWGRVRLVAATLADAGARAMGVDVSPLACREAAENGVPVVRGDLVEPFRADAFDLVAFNPPYLPTPPEQEWDDWMEHALSGGDDGRRLVDPFLETAARAGSGRRSIMLVSVSRTRLQCERTRANTGWRASSLRVRTPSSALVVLRFYRD